MAGINDDLNVLIIDDSHMMVVVMRAVLKKLGYTKVHEAINGEDGLNKVKNEQFDLILLDWHMPKIHGRDFLKAVREMENYKSVPIIVVTAENVEENEKEARSLGASEYLIKPFREDALHEKIEAVFATKSPSETPEEAVAEPAAEPVAESADEAMVEETPLEGA
ncbi:MAG: response regulator [Nitrospinae bacterium]|nr:response regulator [Nitrospinota bacterium]